MDSGAAALTHPDLIAIHDGADLTTTPSNTSRWPDDTIAHGSHCSGIIAGAHNGSGIRGFAPDELLRSPNLPRWPNQQPLDALDYCIEENIDVVNMSLGTGGSSQILLQKLAHAKATASPASWRPATPAGRSSFPGTLPTSSPLGHRPGRPSPEQLPRSAALEPRPVRPGLLSAQFSCHGPEVGVAGPGVAIVSSVPSTGFAAWDGTSMATPHMAGLAALILAHHPDFQSETFKARTAARVDRLFELVRNTATPLQFGDARRSGAGLPDALGALGLGGALPSGGGQQLGALAITTALAQLRQVLIGAGLLVEAASVQTAVGARV